MAFATSLNDVLALLNASIAACLSVPPQAASEIHMVNTTKHEIIFFIFIFLLSFVCHPRLRYILPFFLIQQEIHVSNGSKMY